jgi:pyrroloquinoline-quinone synthase
MVEDLFARISAFIGDCVIAHGWIAPEALVHYKTHASLDIEHADDFFALLEQPFAQSPEQAQQVADGLALGAYLFLQLYQGLFDARAQRAERVGSGPISQADGWTLPKGHPA